VLIGVPALRVRGLALAVTTLAFALAVSEYFLDSQIFEWLPTGIIERPNIIGSISVESETSYFYFALVMLGFALLAAQSLRRSRTGRVLIALRENEPAAEAYGINATRTKLIGFAISGFLAAFAGALYVHHQESLGSAAYSPYASLGVFAMVVIGGLGSLPGAVLGAVYVFTIQWYLPNQWEFLATGAGLLIVLLLLPGGLGSAIADLRDALLRLIARRKQMIVPSLLADRRTDAFEPSTAMVDAVEEATEQEAVPEPTT
jgi:branched-chain amino acid transport system permease protein